MRHSVRSRRHGVLWALLAITVWVIVLAPSAGHAQSQSILKVRATIDGAEVILNGEPVGVTPLIKMVDPGSYELRVQHPHYDNYRQIFEVVSGQAVTIDAELQTIVGTLLVTTTADPATVFIDGEEVGQTPELTVSNLQRGEHDIRVVKPGHLTYSGRVRVQAGMTLKLSVQLRANAAEVTVVTDPPGALVEIDGTAYGESPVTIPTITGGRHGLKVSIPGRSTVFRSFQVRVGDQIEVSAEIPEKGGALVVKSNEDGADVYIEGAIVGQTPLRVDELAPGPYTVRLSLEGYAEAVEAVSVSAGRKARVKAKLVSEEDFQETAFTSRSEGGDKRLVERWWFWALAGGVVAGGAGGGAYWYLNSPGAGGSGAATTVTLP